MAFVIEILADIQKHFVNVSESLAYPITVSRLTTKLNICKDVDHHTIKYWVTTLVQEDAIRINMELI
jgi:hypothetical protein